MRWCLRQHTTAYNGNYNENKPIPHRRSRGSPRHPSLKDQSGWSRNVCYWLCHNIWYYMKHLRRMCCSRSTPTEEDKCERFDIEECENFQQHQDNKPYNVTSNYQVSIRSPSWSGMEQFARGVWKWIYQRMEDVMVRIWIKVSWETWRNSKTGSKKRIDYICANNFVAKFAKSYRVYRGPSKEFDTDQFLLAMEIQFPTSEKRVGEGKSSQENK